MTCPHCHAEITGPELAAMMRSVNSEAQKQAARANGKRPVKEGSRSRGRPRKINQNTA
jgi:hypothetical protein